jgi:membrane protein DedA with SNARE-associated domain
VLESLVSQYGYAAVTVGTFVEGETVLAIGGFFAQRGYLALELVIVCAFVGTFVGDNLCFHLGRWRGGAWLARRPSWNEHAERVSRLMHRHQVPVVVGFRFLYGLRSLTPFAIGASGFPPLRFAVLDGVGAALWSVVVALLGYLIGEGAARLVDRALRYEAMVVGLIAAVGVTVWVVRHRRRR